MACTCHDPGNENCDCRQQSCDWFCGELGLGCKEAWKEWSGTTRPASDTSTTCGTVQAEQVCVCRGPRPFQPGACVPKGHGGRSVYAGPEDGTVPTLESCMGWCHQQPGAVACQHGLMNASAPSAWRHLLATGSFLPNTDLVGLKERFNGHFQTAGSGIVRRECPGCHPGYQLLYYKRFTTPASFDAFDYLLTTWRNDASNQFTNDYNIYPTLQGALEGHPGAGNGNFKYCRASARTGVSGQGFPQGCGQTPGHNPGKQWTTLDISHFQTSASCEVRYSVLEMECVALAAAGRPAAISSGEHAITSNHQCRVFPPPTTTATTTTSTTTTSTSTTTTTTTTSRFVYEHVADAECGHRGYYGHHDRDYVTLEECKAKCSSEVHCKYFTLHKATSVLDRCSRWSECSGQVNDTSYILYKKVNRTTTPPTPPPTHITTAAPRPEYQCPAAFPQTFACSEQGKICWARGITLCAAGQAYPGGSIVNGDAGGETAQDCWRKCNADVQCSHWDFSDNTICRLRSNAGTSGATTASGYHAGARGCTLSPSCRHWCVKPAFAAEDPGGHLINCPGNVCTLPARASTAPAPAKYVPTTMAAEVADRPAAAATADPGTGALETTPNVDAPGTIHVRSAATISITDVVHVSTRTATSNTAGSDQPTTTDSNQKGVHAHGVPKGTPTASGVAENYSTDATSSDDIDLSDVTIALIAITAVAIVGCCIAAGFVFFGAQVKHAAKEPNWRDGRATVANPAYDAGHYAAPDLSGGRGQGQLSGFDGDEADDDTQEDVDGIYGNAVPVNTQASATGNVYHTLGVGDQALTDPDTGNTYGTLARPLRKVTEDGTGTYSTLAKRIAYGDSDDEDTDI